MTENKTPWVDRTTTEMPPGAVEAPVEVFTSENPNAVLQQFLQLLGAGESIVLLYPAGEGADDKLGVHLHRIDAEDFRELIHALDPILQQSIAVPAQNISEPGTSRIPGQRS